MWIIFLECKYSKPWAICKIYHAHKNLVGGEKENRHHLREICVGVFLEVFHNMALFAKGGDKCRRARHIGGITQEG